MADQPHLCDIKLYLNNKWYDGYVSITDGNDILFGIEGSFYYSYEQDTISKLAEIQDSLKHLRYTIKQYR